MKPKLSHVVPRIPFPLLCHFEGPGTPLQNEMSGMSHFWNILMGQMYYDDDDSAFDAVLPNILIQL